MAYGLRYYKELAYVEGKEVRLEILEKNGTSSAKEIGPVCQAIDLAILGENNIDAPIVKTSLTMTFVDAPDHAESKLKKCGNWGEFYTSDATYWQVKVKVKSASQTSFNTIWTGFITPDSYTEELAYRGSVTIVARDNIGHMKDFPFDAKGNEDGMISLREVIEEAWEKIENPMEILYFSDQWLVSEGVNALNTMMNVSAFSDMSWYEALESALESYGAVMRWIGGNEIIVCPMRYLSYVGSRTQQNILTKTPIFMAGAERELTPAARRVEESVKYEIEDANALPVSASDYTGSVERYLLAGNSVDKDGIAYPISNKTSGNGWCNPDYSLFFNPAPYSFAYDKDDDKKYMWLACNSYQINDADTFIEARYAEYSKYLNAENVTFYLKLGSPYAFNQQGRLIQNNIIQSCTLVISVEQNGITTYLTNNGEWVSNKIKYVVESAGDLSIPINLDSFDGKLLVRVRIYQILTTTEYYQGQRFVPVYNAGFSCKKPLLEKNNVNTIYSDTNNIVFTRDLKIGPAFDNVALPLFIKNGIFVKDGAIYRPAKKWCWPGETPQQMAVYNHLQLLCFYAKPNNILRGTIVNADISDLRVIWLWNNSNHILISGSLNFLNGHIENAVIREFDRYDDLWGTLTPAEFPDIEGSSTTNAETSGLAKNEGVKTTNTTTVNIGGAGGGSITVDTFMSDSSTNAVGNKYIKAYVDDNITTLNDELQNWIAKQGYIKGINSAMVTNALGYIPFNSANFTKPNIKSTLGISDWALTTAKPSYKTSEITEEGNLFFTEQRAVNALANTLKSYLLLSGGTMSGDIAMSVNTFLRDEVGNAMIGYNGALVRVGNTSRATDIKGSSVTINGNTPITSANITNQSVASAKSLITSNGLTFADFTSSTVNIGAGTYSNYQTHIYGNAIRLRYGNNGEIGLILNPSGNITVGNTDAASTDYRLYVYGKMRVREQALVGSLKIGTPNDNYFATLAMDGSSLSIDKELKLLAGGTSDICPSIAVSFKAKIAQIQNLVANNVIIGASSGTASNLAFNVQKYTSISSQAPAGLKTLFSIGTDGNATFNGNVYINGNLIVSGDTSSGEAGNDIPASGIISIKVNGIAYEPTNGIVTLPDYPSSLAWSSISGKPTTLAGYGITDGVTTAQLNSTIGNYVPSTGGTFSGEVSAFGYIITNTGTGYHLQFKRGGGNIIWCPAGGYYRIVCNGAGTSDGDATLLIKSGNVSVKGNLSTSGTVTQGSDIRFKDIIEQKTIRIEDIANAPLFTFRWNDREDDIIHLGSSAQYWEGITRELVMGEDFKTIDYATLGVAIGISLAKKAVDQEKRINILEAENNTLKAEIRRLQNA